MTNKIFAYVLFVPTQKCIMNMHLGVVKDFGSLPIFVVGDDAKVHSKTTNLEEGKKTNEKIIENKFFV